MRFADHSVLGLRLSASVRRKLLCCGFSSLEDFTDYSTTEKLQDATNIGLENASLVLAAVHKYSDHARGSQDNPETRITQNVVMESVSSMLKTNLQNGQHIVSFSSAVDELLGGGIPLCKITEIAGEAGLGKTQFCFQLCTAVQIPRHLGGIAAEVVFLDVEGTFSPTRVEQIAAATVEHCRRISTMQNGTQESAGEALTVEQIMSRIYLIRCCDSVQLLAAVHQLKEFLKSHPLVKLIVVDSIAQSFRGEDDFRSRAKILSTLGGYLSDFVRDFGAAVVLTNQISSAIGPNGTSHSIPAMGTKWSHLASNKLMLFKRGESRWLYQYKSSGSPDGAAEYSVVAQGIRDVSTLSETTDRVS